MFALSATRHVRNRNAGEGASPTEMGAERPLKAAGLFVRFPPDYDTQTETLLTASKRPMPTC